MERFGVLLIVIIGLLIFGGILSLEVSLWNECRVDHSWFYCVRMLGK